MARPVRKYLPPLAQLDENLGAYRILISKGKTTLVSISDYHVVRKLFLNIVGKYARVTTRVGTRAKGFYLHKLIMGSRPGYDVDHINGDQLDNRRCNLRFCTRSQNMQNRKPLERSKYKGIHKIRGRYRAVIGSRKNKKHLGYYDTPEGAAKAYNVAAMEMFGKFARLNNV